MQHLVAPGFGLNELRVLLNILDEPVRIFAEPEKIAFLLGFLHRAPAIRALAVHKLPIQPECLAGRAVPPFVFPFIDIPLVIELFKNLLHNGLVPRIRRADKIVVGDIHELPKFLNARYDFIHIFLWLHALFLGDFLYLLAMFV